MTGLPAKLILVSDVLLSEPVLLVEGDVLVLIVYSCWTERVRGVPLAAETCALSMAWVALVPSHFISD